jgi:tRNA(fMet)-specific endonuclease VapC
VSFLLDTSTCIAHLRGRSPAVTQRLADQRASVAISTVVLTELLYGVYKSGNPSIELQRADRFLAGIPILPFDSAAAEAAARLRATLAAAGTPIGPYDLLIAGTAVSRGLAVVTCNAAEFARVPGLAVHDWTRL